MASVEVLTSARTVEEVSASSTVISAKGIGARLPASRTTPVKLMGRVVNCGTSAEGVEVSVSGWKTNR